jgi:hypothetical protein
MTSRSVKPGSRLGLSVRTDGASSRSRPRAIGLTSQRSWVGPPDPEFPIAGFLAMECSPQDLATQFLS